MVRKIKKQQRQKNKVKGTQAAEQMRILTGCWRIKDQKLKGEDGGNHNAKVCTKNQKRKY